MIAIGSDHGGYDLKMKIIAHLQERGLEVKDFGCYDKSSCDYPDFGQAAARAVADGSCTVVLPEENAAGNGGSTDGQTPTTGSQSPVQPSGPAGV